ncbi:MAG: radical SAM protein [Thermoplasmata archaeon]|uniref:Radical SAM protein n=1 Tax=Candidatus Sysuiplasma superficiale TaxID=2823368 RepID=A0A8J7YRJ4_9ARCH|nr:radical SAM protein [Candidatus Sysuiplasma superficiale]
MINVSRLMTGKAGRNDHIRYPSSRQPAPKVMVFNITRNCNLHCTHCYSGSGHSVFTNLPAVKWISALKAAADMGVEHLLISGGEPLMSRDAMDIIREASERGLKVTLSTNGTLLDAERISRLKGLVEYIGISIDGPEILHDKFRGVDGAFRRTLANARRCMAAGIRTGFRFTLTRMNSQYVDFALDLAEREHADRICFYHLGYVGRASADLDIDSGERLGAMMKIMERARESAFEILTADNSVDGILAYFLTGSQHVRSLLVRNGGNRSGERIADIDPDGNVYPDQFTRFRLGGIDDLGSIWEGPSQQVLELRDRRRIERCSRCPYFEMCNGNSRGRALASSGDLWGFDPSCYLDMVVKHFEEHMPPDAVSA